MNPSPIRRRVFYAGRVQGVGFRWTCKRIAGRFGLGGFVKNLPDGRVQLEAEGSADEVGWFLNAVRDQMATNIEQESRLDLPAEGDATFRIDR
jgi:acylphosphatase